ncbi:MAG: response regulator [Desulfomonilaceae bacterium]|nr:response regulator [Desulfomonilaceae bacterium]
MADNNDSPSVPRVLVVDDEEDFLAVLVKRLSKRNLNVVPATRGAEALHILSREPFDAVVLDLNMPGLGGMKTLQEIKRAKPCVEVIILTGQADMRLATEGMELGAFDYMLKPASVDELLYRIEDATKRSMENRKKRTAQTKASA